MIAEKWVDQNAHGGAGPRTIAADSTDGTPTRCVSPARRQRPTALFQTFPALIVNSASTGGDNQAYMFSSAHASVLNAAFADASVRSINYDIDPYIMNSLGTRNGTGLSETTSMEGAN